MNEIEDNNISTPASTGTEATPTEGLTASYYTLGCKLNFAETSTIGKMLQERGVKRAAKGETPTICVVNTCSVTEMADKKGRNLIRRLHRLYPEATLIVTGCYAQLKPEEVAALEGVDIVLGSATAPDTFSRYRTAATTIAATVQSHMHVAAAVPAPSPTSRRRHAAPPKRAERR